MYGSDIVAFLLWFQTEKQFFFVLVLSYLALKWNIGRMNRTQIHPFFNHY